MPEINWESPLGVACVGIFLGWGLLIVWSWCESYLSNFQEVKFLQWGDCYIYVK